MQRMDAVHANHRPLRPIIDHQQQQQQQQQQGVWYPGQFQYHPHPHALPPPPQQHAHWLPPPDQLMHYGHHPQPFTPQDVYPQQGQQYPPPQRPMPPQVTHMYAQPDQAWSNPGWSHQQPWGFTDKNSGLNNEEDWAARARAWAAAKAAMEAQQAQSQFPPLGRSVEHHQGYQDHYQPAVQPHFSEVQQTSLSVLGHQSTQLAPVSISNMPTNQVQDSASHFSADVSSSYTPDTFISYSAKDGTANLEQKAAPISTQGSVTPSNQSYPQEMPANYTSASGIDEQAKPSQASHSPLASPVALLQDEQLLQAQVQASSTGQVPSQPTLQSHFTYSDQLVPPVLEAGHQQPEFEQHIGQDYPQHQQSSYLQPVPTGAIEGPEYNGPAPSISGWPQLGGPAAHFPPVSHAIPASHQFDHPYMPVPHPIHGHPAHLFGRASGPQSGPAFRPNMPPIGGPFGMGPVSPNLAPGPTGIVGPAFMGDNNGTFSMPERPKKASVPNWLREELIKKKAAVVANASAQGSSEDSVHVSGTEGAIQAFRKGDLADSKSVDSTRSSDDEDDEEDEVEAARTAAINQEIKRVLTEVLLKVTDDLFDEIAQEVLDEDDHITQAKKYGVNDHGRTRSFSRVSPPPPSVTPPTVSAKVLISAKNTTTGSDNDSGKSSSSGPGGNVLGLANYASDDDDDTEQSKQQLPTRELEDKEDDPREANQNRDEEDDQFIAEERSISENMEVEKSKMDQETDTDEDKDKCRTKELPKETVTNKEGREEKAVKKRSATEGKLDSQNVRVSGENQGFESKDGVGGVGNAHDNLNISSKVNVPNSGNKCVERHQGSSKDAQNEVEYDKSRSNDTPDREIKRKGNEKNDMKRSAGGAGHGEMKSKKGDNRQQDLVQHRKDGEKERERGKDREKMKDGEKMKDREKNRIGDKRRDKEKEKLRDREGRKGSDRTFDKESRKDFQKERRVTDKMDDARRSDKERNEKNGKGKQRDAKDTRKSRQRSSSVSSRGGCNQAGAAHHHPLLGLERDKFRGLVLVLVHHMPGILIAGIPLILLMRAGASSQDQGHLLAGGDGAENFVKSCISIKLVLNGMVWLLELILRGRIHRLLELL